MNKVHPSDIGLKFPRHIKTKSMKRATTPEDAIQEMVEKYLNILAIRFIRIPNAVYNALFNPNSPVPLWIKKMLAPFFKGIPDLLIFKKDGKYNSCLFIELKTSVGKQNSAQRLFAKYLNVEVCRSFGEAQKLIDEWREN